MLALRRVGPALGLMAALTLSACAPPAPLATPSASPAPTTFASDEEAFRAAEETYRAYVDALNNAVLSDPDTFTPAYTLTTGEAKVAIQESFTQMHADKWAVTGASSVVSVELLAIAEEGHHVTLGACVDVSQVSVFDEAGNSVVSDRPSVQSLNVEVEKHGNDWMISRFQSWVGDPTC